MTVIRIPNINPTIGNCKISESLNNSFPDFPAINLPAVAITSNEHMKKYKLAIPINALPIAWKNDEKITYNIVSPCLVRFYTIQGLTVIIHLPMLFFDVCLLSESYQYV